MAMHQLGPILFSEDPRKLIDYLKAKGLLRSQQDCNSSTQIAMHGSIFIRRGSYVTSSILCIVKGNRQYSLDLPQHRWAGIFSVRRI